MDANQITFRPIGIIHTPFKERKDMPIQPMGGKGIKATIEVFPEFAEGLKDLDKFSYIVLIFNFHLSVEYNLLVKPFMEDEIRGVFATRAPRRPNQIGMSIVKLNKIEKNILHISNIDIVDGTPLLDIKPYVPMVDSEEEIKVGWLENKVKNFRTKNSDDRFIK
ncbi:MAG: tRNA (N6-threonylcarbamoyladenosine(37)-N6)-methyltransferase TrmO [Candidatus Cloacimonetes bacterium]|nr:tRNA (N6-threonylcarbamoyladenosine(37)-N6)-methyltransferase TrmO [Candidatus Cloacimonadota bacterium]MCF7813305.1 tRNA (N6-threonylcarbamoyladenosine(37)-N6)-methyltransferase TrmO [Candidatus Cloacimonadota bacterium]MCF7867380.1 tRNA (N6-threonylcarbamoyladenosine(37)-N6)-methyltransferase TrmO [Candidatus Cloacimonadota bacterium]MCF7882814.1 tRNA (N6-threonylcarbamoyladenosine(37)-N6)-methyltransferase TrmO [Candidatus Cloacimonadota bacterium]